MSVEVEDAKPEDASAVAYDVRADDLEEWVLASGRPFHQTLKAAIEQGGHVKIMTHAGRPLCVWGVNPGPTPETGLAWLVGTNAGARLALFVQRHFRSGIADLHAEYPILHAWAYEGNRLHHHWMERLGFVRTGQEKRLGMGARFILFVRHKEPQPCASPH